MKVVLVALLLVGIMSMPAHAEPRWKGPCSGWDMGETLQPKDWHGTQDRRDLAVTRIKRLIACVFGHWAPGNSGIALYVADRESSFYPWAENPSSHCSGLFQHILSAWPGRVQTYLWRGWFGVWPPSVFDPRANAIVAARMVEANGWGPWSL